MKNVDKIVAQAREWATQACSIAEISNADLRTAERAKKERIRIAKLCVKARRAYECASADADAPILGAKWSRIYGAYDAVHGLARAWEIAEDNPELGQCAQAADSLLGSFMDCAAGLALVFSASDGFASVQRARVFARNGALELFNTLAREGS